MTDKKPGDLIPRVLSALVLAPIVLGAAWFGGLPFQLMMALVIVLMAYEWTRLTCGPVWHIEAIIMAGTALAAMLATVTDNLNLLGWIILAGMAVSGGLGWVRGQELRWRLLGVPYISLGPVALVWLRDQDGVGLTLIVWLLLVIWAMDIGAYFAGRAIGGPKLAPRASPNKTWAGLIGGMVCAGVVGGAVASATSLGPVWVLAELAVAVGVWSQVGDIAESMVKRHFGVKDMSNLIPGQGGILDRVDGLLFAAPAMAAFILVTGSI